MDENIKWTEHILKIKQKISRGFGVISKARKFLNSSTLVTLYYSFVYPHITYCIQVWGSANDYLIKSIFKLQKKIVRMIKRFSYDAPSEPIFHLLGILPIFKVYVYCIFIFMYTFNQGLLPKIFNDMFVRNAVIHEHYTRSLLIYMSLLVNQQLS